MTIFSIRIKTPLKLICWKCGRYLPHIKMKTKNGCLWCDSEYWLNKGE